MVRYHDLAKIVLCDEDFSYYSNLSQASKDSYYIQLDKYAKDREGVRYFLSHPNKNLFLIARMYDDKAKIKDLKMSYMNKFEDYREMFNCVLNWKTELKIK